MFGQMTAGSWIYIGSQGILQGTYETFGACARKHFGGTLSGRLVVTGGLGGMGGAQPLAVKMNSGVCLAAEIDPERVRRRLQTEYLDQATTDIDEALSIVDQAIKNQTKQLKNKTKVIKITSAGLNESHVHSISITRESPNYQLNK